MQLWCESAYGYIPVLLQVQHLDFQLAQANSSWLEQEFIDARLQDGSLSAADFHKQLTVCVLLDAKMRCTHCRCTCIAALHVCIRSEALTAYTCKQNNRQHILRSAASVYSPALHPRGMLRNL